MPKASSLTAMSVVPQHNAIVERMDALVAEASDDVRVLARLWQLQNKMQSVGAAGSYGEHLQCQRSDILLTFKMI